MFIRWITRSNRRGTYNFCYLSETKWIEGKPNNQTLAALGCVVLKPTKPEREVFWMQVDASLNRFQLSTEQREKIESAIAQKVPIGKQKESGKGDEWYTPDTEKFPVLTLVQRVLTEIDLDPCSNPEKTVPAKAHYTKEDNGLAQIWRGTVFMNPPYSTPLPWVKKLLEQYQAGNVTEAIALLKAGTESNKGTGKLLSEADAVAKWNGRLEFVPGARTINKNAPDFDSAFFYFGNNVDLFKKVFQPYCHRIRS